MSDATGTGGKKKLVAILAIVVIVAVAVAAVYMFVLKGPEQGQPGPMPGGQGVGQQTQVPGQPGPRGKHGPGPGGPGGGPTGLQQANTVEPLPLAPAGVKVTPRGKQVEVDNYVPGKPVQPVAFVPRSDPFALLPAEVKAQKTRSQLDLLALAGGFRMYITPKPRPLPDAIVHPLEQQPYRRLAGIVRGDSIAAILEEDGDPASPQVVKPGDKVGEWTVRSIDSEKAVLYRPGNRRPNVVVVRLESRPTVGVAAGGSGGGAAPAGGPLGAPGGPGGMPGGRGRGGPRGGPSLGPGVGG